VRRLFLLQPLVRLGEGNLQKPYGDCSKDFQRSQTHGIPDTKLQAAATYSAESIRSYD
jgi:hypothetical protein